MRPSVGKRLIRSAFNFHTLKNDHIRHQKIHFYPYQEEWGTSIASALYPNAAPFSVRLTEHISLKYLHKKLPFGPKRLSGHVIASDVIARIGQEKFEEYFSFAIVRNPWDWQACLYSYILKRPHHPLHEKLSELGSFSSYLSWHCGNIESNTLPAGVGSVFQYDYICDSKKNLLVSYIGKVENLKQDFRNICSSINIQAKLPHLRQNPRKEYRDLYSENDRKLVERVF